MRPAEPGADNPDAIDEIDYKNFVAKYRSSILQYRFYNFEDEVRDYKNKLNAKNLK